MKLALLCMTMMAACVPAHAGDVPRFRITIPAGMAQQEPGGIVRFAGTATVLVRVRGLTVLIDPGSDDGMLGPELQQADVVLLSQPGWTGNGAGWAMRPIVAQPASAGQLRGQGFHSVYPLDTWEGITIRKGDTRLRLTSMPDVRGMRPAAMAAMLDFGPACRVLVHHGALSHADIEAIPLRFPGARLALLRQDGTPLLLTVAPNGREAQLRRPVARGEPYRFGTADCR